MSTTVCLQRDALFVLVETRLVLFYPKVYLSRA
jgi:hypothetical protein